MKAVARLLLAAWFALCPPALGAERGTADEAVAMVKSAVAYLKKQGPEKAYAAFNDPHGQFRDRDLYVIVFDLDGKGLAHINPRLVGKLTGDIRDADGKAIFQAQRRVALEQGSGWVDYKWPNPVSGKIENKSTYLERVGDIMVMCGIYK